MRNFKVFACVIALVFCGTINSLQAQTNGTKYLRGDVNEDNQINILDVMSVVDIIYNGQPTIITVTTAEVTDIIDYSAVCGGNVTDNGGMDVLARGVCWSTVENPTVADNITSDGSGLGEFTSTMTGLTGSTTYYVRAYAINNADTAYGEQKVFTTDNSYNYQIVDLGLPSGTLWADRNIGATAPEGYGDYYAWGETHTKAVYTESNYDPLGDGYNGYDYIGTNIQGTQYDVAYVQTGGEWKMPSITQIEEIIYNCEWEWTTLNGENGYMVTGPNGNTCFFPAADGLSDKEDIDTYYGFYWSGTWDEDYMDHALGLFFYSQIRYRGSTYKYYGQPIRAVKN